MFLLTDKCSEQSTRSKKLKDNYQNAWDGVKDGKAVIDQFYFNKIEDHTDEYTRLRQIERERLENDGRVFLLDLLAPFTLSQCSSGSVIPLDVSSLSMMFDYKSGILNQIPFENEHKESLCSSASYDKLINNNSSISMKVNLKENNDKFILDRIKELLPKWREELNIEEPKSSMSISKVHVKKIIDYQVIPYLDLLVHQKIEGIKIPHRVIVEALFNEKINSYTEIEFRQVILKFIKKITDPTFQFKDGLPKE
jgi:6-pyruvoyl-tetrahydropterin synthase